MCGGFTLRQEKGFTSHRHIHTCTHIVRAKQKKNKIVDCMMIGWWVAQQQNKAWMDG